MANAGLYLIYHPGEEGWARRVEAYLGEVYPVDSWSLGARNGGPGRIDHSYPQVGVLLVSRCFLAAPELRFELPRLRALKAETRLQLLALLLEPCSEQASATLGDLPCRTLVGISESAPKTEVERILEVLVQEVGDRLEGAAISDGRSPVIDLDEIFAQLYAQHYSTLVAFFGRRNVDPETSRDLAQATMMKVYQGLGGFQSRASSRSWVLRIATHVWCNWVRDQQMTEKRGAQETSLEQAWEQGLQVPEGQTVWPFEGNDPERIAVERQAVRRIQDKISDLSERQRDCLTRWLEGWSYQEMADELGVSIQTIRASLHKARRRVALELRQEFQLSKYEAAGVGQ